MGDCLEVLKGLPDNSVDMVLCDPPYGTTACKWDTVIPFAPFWDEVERVAKTSAAVVLFGSQPFTSALISSNFKNFKYQWVWEKSNPSNIALANKQPMKYHEDIAVFYRKQPTFNKQMIERISPRIGQAQASGYRFHNSGSDQTALKYIEKPASSYSAGLKNPSSVLKFNSLRPNSKEFVKHPTQKPVALLEYLIRTYTNEGETVLDPTMGSGSTGVAALNTGRKFIGIEREAEYHAIAEARIANHNP